MTEKTDHTPAPWPESPALDYSRDAHNPVVRVSPADYAHARRCVNFVARLEADIARNAEDRVQCLKRLDKAEAEVRKWRAANERNAAKVQELEEAESRLEAEVQRLRKALENYGEHDGDRCGYYREDRFMLGDGRSGCGQWECHCGLDKALAEGGDGDE